MWCKRFCRSEEGVSLVFVTVALPVIMGFALLVIDGSRVFSLHNDLQKGADALALAAGAELDGTSDAIERAERAITNLVQNRSNFSDDGLDDITIDDVSRRYLLEIPADDDDPITDAYEVDMSDLAAASREARFVEVRINPKNLTAIFPASFLGAGDSVTLSSTAVAGFGQSVCDFTPLYICNPYELEPDGLSLEEAVANRSTRRKMIELRKQGPNSANGPGNFAFLSSPVLGTGADALREAIARVKPLGCYSSNGVDTQPGQVASVRVAVNVRFDLYDGAMSGKKNQSDYRPARNVRKGYDPDTGSGCSQDRMDPSEHYQRLPRDSCFADQSCTVLAESGDPGRLGDGIYDFETYWEVNHGSPTYAAGDGETWSNDNLPTRYDVYLEELGSAALLDDLSGQNAVPPPDRPETSHPACYSGTIPPNDTPDRRLLYGAIVDCIANPIVGATDDVPVRAFGSFFVTEPVEQGGGGSEEDPEHIRIELVDISGHFGQGTMEEFVRDVVQLYR